MVEAVIFDLDGTIINLPIDYDELFDQFRKIMKTENIQPITETIAKLGKKTRIQVFKVWGAAEANALPRITPNIEGIVIYKAFSNAPKALVTLQGKALAMTILKHLNLSFDVIITREDSLSRIKQLKKAAQQLETKPQSVLFVGNTEGDQAAADEFGCQFLKITSEP